MKLSDEEYHNLKKDQVISGAIRMINDIMYKYRNSLEIYKKFRKELSREEFYKKMKVHTTKKDRVNKLQKKKYDDLEASDAYLELTKSLIKHPIYCDFIGVDIENLKEYWLPTFQFRQQMLSENKRRTGPNIERDAWFEQIVLRLINIGVNIVERRIDFVYKLFMEYDWGKYQTYIQGEVEAEYASDDKLRDIIKKIDQKARSNLNS